MITTPHMDDLVEMALANGAEGREGLRRGWGRCIAFLCATAQAQDIDRFGDSRREILKWKWRVTG